LTILELQKLYIQFGGLIAVNDVSLSVEAGQIYGIIGPNGAGKTTLLNLIAGSHKPEAGTVHYRGENISASNPETRCRNGISRTFQISQPFPKMTVLENVMVAAVFGGGRQRSPDTPRKNAVNALRFVELPLAEDTLAENLNTVQLKRLDLARALASTPILLLLDEVAAGLTPGELTDLTLLIRRMRAKDVTIIIVEHLMRMIMKLCDRIAVLHYGEKIAEGTPEEISRDRRVAEAYLGENYLL
jgi:branched-chain amino acid transport system ATP-binding protein